MPSGAGPIRVIGTAGVSTGAMRLRPATPAASGGTLGPLLSPCRQLELAPRGKVLVPCPASLVLWADRRYRRLPPATGDHTVANQPKHDSWWRTLPGVLTAIAATVTALTGLVVALDQSGLFRRGDADPVAGSAVQGAPPVTGGGAATPMGRSTRVAAAYRVELAEAQLRVGPIQYQVLNASAERVSDDALQLRFSMRFTNVEIQWGVAIGPAHFRLMADGVPLAPREAYIGVVSYQSAEQGDVVFTLPADAAALQLQLGEVGQTVRTVDVAIVPD
jgi:hypothetical protein